MNISINIKSGTGGYYDYDGCDLCIKKIKDDNFPIPRIGESMDILEKNDAERQNPNGKFFKEYHQYLVTDVRCLIDENSHGVTVYVVPIGRSVK